MHTDKGQHLLFTSNIYAFALNFQSSALLTISVPAMLIRLAPAQHTIVLAQLATLSAFVAMIVPPVVGVLADRGVLGGRHGSLRIGGGLNALGLVGMYLAPSEAWFMFWCLVTMLGHSTATVAYQALWSEVIPESRRGQASGYNGAAVLLGTILGLGTAALSPKVSLLPMAGVIFVGFLVTTLCLPKTDAPTRRARRAQRSRGDFVRIFFAQALISFGMTLLMTFVLYFFHDVLHISNPSQGTAFVAGLALIGAVFASIALGRVADASRRRRLTAVSIVPMALAAGGFAFLQAERWILVFALVFGLGFGGFLATSWALTVDVLPDREHVGRDLGIWGVASAIPAVLAPMAGGWVLTSAATATIGYRRLFLLAAASFLAGALVVWSIRSQDRLHRGMGHPTFADDGRSVSAEQPGTAAYPSASAPAATAPEAPGPAPSLTPPSPWWGVPLRLLIAGIVAGYVRLCYRVRFDGPLPQLHGGSLIVSNHQHDLEGMVIPAWLNLRRTHRHPVYCAASQRLFEPGFLAFRGPAWLRPLLYRLNLAPLFRSIGVLPIENQPLARPLQSYAYEALRLRGNVSLGEVFTAPWLERLGLSPDQPLSRLWSVRWAERSMERMPSTCLVDDLRRQVRRAQQQRIRQQLDQIRAVLLSGRALYLTPEGRYSQDGRMMRFRQSYIELAPLARNVYAFSLSYDPYVHRSLSLYVRVGRIPPEVKTDVAAVNAWVAAARPVVVSQVLCDWLSTLPPGTVFSAAEAREAVRQRVLDLPPGARLVPELVNPMQTTRAVRRALAGMVRLGSLRPAEGDKFCLTAVHRHPMFADVEDMVRFQATVFRETREALFRLAGSDGWAADGGPQEGEALPISAQVTAQAETTTASGTDSL
ncbi:MFS transporter [Alicyclobacillus shizuokensis]|uniref:MFS transporter n=1 Tax=Alicyclobacillus shizuokensis TaxID=392014 RepID=UPI00082C89BD|nr:MFS transporter [Alicyclobacillus shizuokensis]